MADITGLPDRLPSTTDHLVSYFKKHWVQYVGGVIFIFLATWFSTQIPRLLGEGIDHLREGRSMDAVRRAALLLAGSAFGAFALRFVWRLLVNGFCRGAETYLRQSVFAHLEVMSSDFYIKFNTGDIITRAISDVTGIRFMFAAGFVSIIDATVTFTLVAINMLNSAGPAMSTAALAPIPVLIFFIALIRLELRRRQRAIRVAASHMASKVQENLTGIHVIKGFAQEDSERADFSGRSLRKWRAEMDMARLSNIIGPIIQIVFGAVFTLFIIVGSRMIAAGSMTVGEFTAFNGFILLMVNPVANIGQAIERWQNGLAAITRLDEIILFRPEVRDDLADPDALVTEGRIELRGLNYAYPKVAPGSGTGLDDGVGADMARQDADQPILKDVSIDIKPGEVVAVTGPTGCGKSTLVSLLARQWAIGEGMVFIDGRDINHIPIRNLRGVLGYVPQDNFLFSVSVMENIRFYDEGLSDEDVYAAAKAVSVHESILSFSEGYGTVVGERGVTLSGGQMQRIAIARALARRPRIMLLDDCFSAVDAETERAILEGLRSYLRDTTAIIITHRVASAALADRILVLSEDGSGAELGTYEELVASGGKFCNLVRMQTGA